jgi:hypothetical protein
MMSVAVSGGVLRLRTTVGGPPVTWYADGEGPALYKEVTGDFTVTAVVRRSYDPTAPTQPPPPEYRLGGLNLHDPASSPGRRNWLHVAIGSGTQAIPIAVEDKSTVLSNSSLQLYPIQSARGEVRITRSGPTVSLYYRDLGAPSWQLLRSHNRPDLPATLQVGPTIFSWQNPPNVAVEIDEVRFNR